MKGPGEIHLDGPKAVKTAGAVGLAVLGIALLPGLLRPPEPEPLPADVGFRPAENLGAVTRLPAPDTSNHPREEAGRPGGRVRTKRPGAGRPRPDGVRAGGATGSRKAGKAKYRGRNEPGIQDGQPAATAPTEAVEVAPPPVTAWMPPPAPVADPEPAGDGSLEFAPR